MNYKLYQIDLEKDTERYAFLGQEFLDELGLCFPPPRELYSLTYEGNCTDINPRESPTAVSTAPKASMEGTAS